MGKIKVKINSKTYTCNEGKTILELAEEKDIKIPSLCHHPDFCAKGNCRVCVVEVKGMKKLQTACSTKLTDKMEIETDNERVKKVRNMNIELIYAEHIEQCATCIWRFECKLLKYAQEYKTLISRFWDRKRSRLTYKFANAVEIDGTQCIDCRNCIDACSQLQNINYLEVKGKNSHQEIVPTSDKKKQCILCGQCAVHCPVSAAQEQAEWNMVEKEIKNTKKIVIAQFAPALRVSIGEPFGVEHGQIMTEQLVTSLKELGFNYVFDVNFAADVTTIVEAEELLKRITEKKELPMFTSCCPGWVNYVEFYHPELIPYLTTSRSPQIHNGGIIKTYWAKQMNVDPKNIIVVSIMPCTAKKFEAVREEMRVNGHYPVDYVLTTRELAFMLKKNNIDLPKLKKTKADNPLGQHSGAAAIFGGTGGVMESALRTAHVLACGDKNSKVCKDKIEFKEVRGMEGIRDAVVDVAGTKLKIAIVSGIANVEHVIKRLDEYHYIEVMACPGGCIGGGGQPIPTSDEIRKKRIEALYKIDKKSKIKKSYENEGAKEVLKWLETEKLSHKILHTKYQKRERY